MTVVKGGGHQAAAGRLGLIFGELRGQRTEHVPPGKLGERLTSVMLAAKGVKALEDSLLVTEISGNSPAEDHGLLPGDCIVSVDGHSMASFQV